MLVQRPATGALLDVRVRFPPAGTVLALLPWAPGCQLHASHTAPSAPPKPLENRRRSAGLQRCASWPYHLTPPPPPCSTAGTALGYASSLLYLLSRLSQLWKNHVRGSAEGLAISMFLCAIAANSLYGASILLRCASAAELRSSLPWLVGSLGTVALDLGILVQSRALGGAPKHHPSDEDEPLLQP